MTVCVTGSIFVSEAFIETRKQIMVDIAISWSKEFASFLVCLF